MIKTTHIVIGLHTALFTQSFFPMVLLGATLPDIDIAWGYKRTSQGYKPRDNMPRWLGHRGFTHWLGSYVPIMAGMLLLHPVHQLLVQAFLIGVASHLLADMLTPGGIPIYSFQRKTSLRLVRTRSKMEYCLLAAMIAGLFFVPMSLYHKQFMYLELFVKGF